MVMVQLCEGIYTLVSIETPIDYNKNILVAHVPLFFTSNIPYTKQLFHINKSTMETKAFLFCVLWYSTFFTVNAVTASELIHNPTSVSFNGSGYSFIPPLLNYF